MADTAELARCGDLGGLRAARARGCPWDPKTTRAAAEYGYLDCLRYAHEQGCVWDPETTMWAAKTGQLECLRYAHRHGCPWDSETLAVAADDLDLDCLRYAREHGCPWDRAELLLFLAADPEPGLQAYLDEDTAEGPLVGPEECPCYSTPAPRCVNGVNCAMN